MKRAHALFITLVMCITLGINAFILRSIHSKAESFTIENGSFGYKSMFTGKNASYTFDYDESCFDNDAQNYNHNLARVSLCVSMAAASKDADNIKELLLSLEFPEKNTVAEYPRPQKDTIGYILSHKKAGEGSLVVCAVRGGEYGAEWADNFNVGTEGNHAGFENQASKVNAAIDRYIKDNMLDKESVKIWITGFSRGGATSNIAAHYLSESYGNENVYAYCFECPKGVDMSQVSGIDRNIFNIVNDIDFITYLAPSGWNFGRYGITMYVPSEKTSRDYEAQKKEMALEYGSICTTAQNGEKKSDWKVFYESPEMSGQAKLIDSVFNSIAKSMTRQEAEKKLFYEIRESIIKYYENGNIEINVDTLMAECAAKIIKSIGIDALILFMQSGMNIEEFTNALSETVHSHYPELCLAWMNVVTDAEMTDDYTGRLFVKKETSAKTFADVSKEDYFYEPVLWALENGIAKGEDGELFNPQHPCPRGQLITYLWRAKGSPEPETEICPFTDISRGDECYKAVLWAFENGIAKGISETLFNPHGTVTRGQAATFLWRAKGSPEPETEICPFTDITGDVECCKAVIWAHENKIAKGTSETIFNPHGTVTRGQAVTFLYRRIRNLSVEFN